ncbi:GGDEF domain-containing protein [Rheinheimera tilapiae]|uniref:diguanylate cyclase n=1 Tax=Rheinheimera tilapiae TaxID=875043 RepID=A0ABV6BEN3_9GAMM
MAYVWPLALVVILVIAVADYYTGVLVTLSAFYIVPLFLVAWTRTRFETHLLILMIVGAWSCANYLSDAQHLSAGILIWNSFIRWLHLTMTAELVRYIRRLLTINSDLANIDVLTGIPNRRFFNYSMQHVLLFPPANKIVSFTLIDVDYFKVLNDAHGHQFGDEILKKVSQQLASECMKNEFCGRIGGDEFAIVLCCDDFVDSKNRIKRLAQRISENASPCSLGTSLVSTGQLLTEVFEQADKALYQTKSGGRGYATIFDGCHYHKAI